MAFEVDSTELADGREPSLSPEPSASLLETSDGLVQPLSSNDEPSSASDDSLAQPQVDKRALDLIARGCARRLPIGQTTFDFYRSITHLHLSNLKLRSPSLDHLHLCPSLSTLYVYGNELTTLAGLSGLRRLTHVYAQDNQLEELGFDASPSLESMLVGGNRLARVSGFHNASGMRELRLGGQKPASLAGSIHKTPLELERESLWGLSISLRVLDLSDCGVGDGALAPLVVLRQLERLDLSRNALSGTDELRELLLRLPLVSSLQVDGNPLCSNLRWRDPLVRSAESLSSLNGAEVTAQERSFLQKLAARQLAPPRQRPPKTPRDGKGLPSLRGKTGPRRPATIDSRACHELSWEGPEAARPMSTSNRHRALPRGDAGPWISQSAPWHGRQQ